MLRDYEKPHYRDWHDAERGHLQNPPPPGAQTYRIPPHIPTAADVAIMEAANELQLEPGAGRYPTICTLFYSVGPCAVEPVPLGPLDFVAVPFGIMCDASSHRAEAWSECLHMYSIWWSLRSEVAE